MTAPALVRRTQLVDLARSVPLGIVLPLETSVLLTIAIKQFDASGIVKGCIAAAGGVGLLATPFVTAVARRSGRPAMLVAAVLCAAAGLGLALGASGSLLLFMIGSIIGIAGLNSTIPLLTATYDRNFPASQRGARVAWGMAIKVGVAATCGLLMGSFLTRQPERWWIIVLVGAGALLATAACNLVMPSPVIHRVAGMRNRPWPHFHLLAEDRRLRLTLGAWMLMGFGNLMLLPLRVEYLARPEYGIAADAALITLLTVTIPSVVRLVFIPVFGTLFDRISFFTGRILVNLLFALYIAAFFTGNSTAGLVIGAAVLGVAAAGGDLMWSLWVTKFAPAGRVADYMGLHTFSTGIRAVCAPLIAFVVVEYVSITPVAIASSALIIASSLVLVPEARLERAARARAAAPV